MSNAQRSERADSPPPPPPQRPNSPLAPFAPSVEGTFEVLYGLLFCAAISVSTIALLALFFLREWALVLFLWKVIASPPSLTFPDLPAPSLTFVPLCLEGL